MKTKLKAWIYQWPDDKRLQDGQILFKRLIKKTVKDLNLKETAVIITIGTPNGN